MIIIGAGMAGLLAGVINPNATLYEAKPHLPQDHKAVFRLRSDEISRYTGIPFKKHKVHKALWYKGQEAHLTPRLANLYSYKVSGQFSSRSILNLEPEWRWIPPQNFLERLAQKCQGRIVYSSPIRSLGDIFCITSKSATPIISTLPMPLLAQIINAKEQGIDVPRHFPAREIYVTRYEIEACDAHATIYYPDPALCVYRASLTGDQLIIESTEVLAASAPDSQEVLASFGVTEAQLSYRVTTENHLQPLGKIAACEEIDRRNFITKATLMNNIFSLGRYATWRPGVMLDDVFKDIFVIRELIEGGIYSIYRAK